MIRGIGCDLTDIGRLKRILEQTAGSRFLQRILTDAELELAEERKGRLAEFAAGRFAAKEAIVKALGCGIGREIGFRDIEILPDGKGKPHVTVSGAALERLQAAEFVEGAFHIHLSITHTPDAAMAYAVVEQR